MLDLRNPFSKRRAHLPLRSSLRALARASGYSREPQTPADKAMQSECKMLRSCRYQFRSPSSANHTFYGSSDASQSEIHAPIPRRHHLLQAESPQWMYTPSISPSSSRPVSPATAHGTFGRHTQLSFSALLEEPVSQQRVMDGQRGWARKWVRWMHQSGRREWVIPISILGTAWLKWVVGLGGYSGLFLALTALRVDPETHHLRLSYPPNVWGL